MFKVLCIHLCHSCDKSSNYDVYTKEKVSLVDVGLDNHLDKCRSRQPTGIMSPINKEHKYIQTQKATNSKLVSNMS